MCLYHSWCPKEGVAIIRRGAIFRGNMVSYSGIIPFVYKGKEQILKYMRHEVSMIANQRTKSNRTIAVYRMGAVTY